MHYLAPKIALFRQDHLKDSETLPDKSRTNLAGPAGPTGPSSASAPLSFLEAFRKLDLGQLPWESAMVAQAQSGVYQDSQLRNNSKVTLSGTASPDLAGLEQALFAFAYQTLFLYDPNLRLTNFGFDLLRYGVGQHFHQHADLIPGHPIFGKRVVSLLAYLNDDYLGGEISFPNQKLMYKPKAGDVILFPSGMDYPHASLDVSEGLKYVAVSWFYRM